LILDKFHYDVAIYVKIILYEFCGNVNFTFCVHSLIMLILLSRCDSTGYVCE